MGKRIYVGNMSYQTTEDTLRTLFGEFGEVEEISVVTDRYTGRPKGFGFVEMSTDDAARAAIEALNGRTVDDRPLNVAEARPRQDRDRRSSDRYQSRW